MMMRKGRKEQRGGKVEDEIRKKEQRGREDEDEEERKKGADGTGEMRMRKGRKGAEGRER